VGVNKRKQSFTQTLEEILAPIFYIAVLIILLVIWYAVYKVVMLPELAYLFAYEHEDILHSTYVWRCLRQ